ncbi:MAG: ABC transporter ATP-binding protein [bacterium]|nr:ABC transporter ATP-binding protein [bacterium]
MFEAYRKLRSLLGPKERRGFYIILVGVLINAVLETVGVGVILPFISIVDEPAKLADYPFIVGVLDFLGAHTDRNRILTIGGAILGLMIFKNGFFYLFTRFQLSYIYNNSVVYSIKLLDSYLEADYLFHLQTNSAVLMRNLKQEVPLLFSRVLLPLSAMITELTIAFFISLLLIYTAPVATITGAVLIGGIAVVFYRAIRKKARIYGQARLEHEAETYKWLNQSLNGIKEAKLFGARKFLVNQTESHYQQLAKIIVYEYLTGQMPRIFLEVLMAGGLILVVILLTLQGMPSGEILPTLALFGAAAFRLMPAANRSMGNLLTLKLAGPSLDNVYNSFEELKSVQIDQATLEAEHRPLAYEQQIEIDQVSFYFPGAEAPALDQLSFKIPKNQSVGIMGPSGSGKSTFLNLLLGLLLPSQGCIRADGVDVGQNLKAWRQMIGFVPQEIYLTDDVIARNVAYGLPDEEIDRDRVWEALEMAQLKELVTSMPEGLDSYVGERGVRLSGGQRQRIGIARALYHNPEILVFDEATSALDTETEKEITKSIEALAHKKTIIIVAHRLSTIENCDVVYRLDHGRLKTHDLKGN